MPRLRLLANPAASSFTGGLHRDVMTVLRQGYEVEAIWPTDTTDAIRLARQAVDDKVDVIVAMGGDGIVHHVANTLAGTGSALGIIPAGTTNVLADILHIPTRPIEAAYYLLKANRPEPIGIVSITMDGAPPVFATFSAGIGLDAEVVESAEKRPTRKTHFGWFHYGRSTFEVLFQRFRRRLPNLRVVAEGRRFDAVTLLVQAHWPYSYFGKVPLSFSDHAPDGVHVAVFETLPLHRVANVGVHVLAGSRLEKAGGVHVLEDVFEVTVEADPPALVQADGELLGSATHIEIRAAPNTLTVMAPAFRPKPKTVRSHAGVYGAPSNIVGTTRNSAESPGHGTLGGKPGDLARR